MKDGAGYSCTSRSRLLRTKPLHIRKKLLHILVLQLDDGRPHSWPNVDNANDHDIFSSYPTVLTNRPTIEI